MRPEDASSRWRGLPEADDAAPIAMAAYVRAYGPTTADAFGTWLAGGWFGKRRLHAWFGELEPRLAEVDVEGEPRYVLADDLHELASTTPEPVVRLLPGFDQYVLGPGTADGHVVPPARRSEISRQSGWISPVVISGGVVRGTWQVDGGEVGVTWFREAGRVPRRHLQAEVKQLSSILGRDLRLVLDGVE
jgi:Winged helix DNA-binding domain